MIQSIPKSIFLDKYIDCPTSADDGVIVTHEKKAMELMLFSGDIRKYGPNKAIPQKLWNSYPRQITHNR